MPREKLELKRVAKERPGRRAKAPVVPKAGKKPKF